MGGFVSQTNCEPRVTGRGGFDGGVDQEVSRCELRCRRSGARHWDGLERMWRQFFKSPSPEAGSAYSHADPADANADVPDAEPDTEAECHTDSEPNTNAGCFDFR
jgi:hypothetical protein